MLKTHKLQEKSLVVIATDGGWLIYNTEKNKFLCSGEEFQLNKKGIGKIRLYTPILFSDDNRDFAVSIAKGERSMSEIQNELSNFYIGFPKDMSEILSVMNEKPKKQSRRNELVEKRPLAKQ